MLFLTVFVSFLPFCLCQSQQPNIIFILADDLGWDDIGYRNPTVISPTIDKLFDEGIVLNEYYVQATCSPTRSALMTGRYPLHNGVICVILSSQAVGLPLSEVTIGNVFLDYGYETHIVGKWHLGMYKWEYTPTFRGFQSFYGYYQGSEDYYTHINSNYYDFHDDSGLNCGNNCSKIVTDAYEKYSAYLFNNRAIDIINNHTKNKDTQNKALFLYLPFQNVHSPRQVPSYYIDKYYSNTTLNNTDRIKFSAMVTCLDDAINNITNVLKNNNMLNNSIIVFSSDNGAPVYNCGGPIGGSNVPYRGGKHSVWEGGTKVNGAVWIGDTVLKNWNISSRQEISSNFNQLMHIADFMPTLITGAKLNLSEIVNKYNISFDGMNQWENLLGLNNDNNLYRDQIYYGINNPCNDDWIWNNTAIRTGSIKYLNTSGSVPNGWFPPPGSNSTLNTMKYYNNNNEFTFKNSNLTYNNYLGLLFNLSDDPYEYTNIASSNQDMVMNLGNILQQYENTRLIPHAPFNDSAQCQNITHPVYPIVGGVWLPWC